MIGRSLERVYPPELARRFRDQNQRVIETSAPITLEEEVEGRDGRRDLFTIKFPLRDTANQIEAVGGISFDITERRRTEKALEESRRRLQALFDNTTDAIWLLDDLGQFVDANPAVCALLGYSRDEFLQMNVADVTPVQNRELVDDLWRTFLATGQLSGEFTQLRKDGSTRDVDYRAVAHILPGHHLSVNRDITERKQTEEELRWKESMLAEAQLLAHIGSWSRDIVSNEVTWSDEHYRIFGLRPQAMKMTFERVLSRIHPDDRARVRNRVDQALRDRHPYECCYRTLHDDGTVRVVHSRARVVFDEHGNPVRTYGTVQDITERTRARRRSRTADGAFRPSSRTPSTRSCSWMTPAATWPGTRRAASSSVTAVRSSCN